MEGTLATFCVTFDPNVKVKGTKTGICDGVPSSAV